MKNQKTVLLGLAVLSIALVCFGYALPANASVCSSNCGSVSLVVTANGQSHSANSYGAISITAGSPVTLAWTTSGLGTCNTGVTEAPYGPNITAHVPSGSTTINPTHDFVWALQCSIGANNSTNMIIEDGIKITVTAANNSTGTITCSTDSQCGASGYTGSPSCSAGNVFQNYLNYTGTCHNAGTTTSFCASPTSVYQQSHACTSGTTCSNGACVTTGSIVCSTDSQCGTNGYTGSPSCSNGNVFQNYFNYSGTCHNAGTTTSYCASPTSTFQQQTVCGSGQSCSNGACVTTGNGGNGNLVASCNASPSSIQANQSTTFNGSAAGGNGIYSYAWTGACNAGSQNCSATFSSAGTYTALLTVTSGSQSTTASCSVGVNGNNNNNICNQNSTLKCIGNSLYWFDSCNNQGAWYQTCGSNQYCSNGTCQNNNYNNNNYCTYHSYQSCQSGSVHWFDSCGADQGISQACTGNQYCSGNICINQNINYNNNNYSGNVTVTTQVRDLSSGNLNWSTFIAASPSDILQYQITLQNNSGTNLNNVIVRDNLPPNLIYSNNLMVDGIANGGNITYGVNIGSLGSYQTRTVTYQVQVAPAQNFTFGTTTLNDSVSVTSDNGNAANSSDSVTVNRSGVLGATSVSTGLLTGNFWVDSFILPLILALIALWAWQAGLLNTFGIAEWVGGKKAKKNELVAHSKLQEKINAIRNQNNA